MTDGNAVRREYSPRRTGEARRPATDGGREERAPPVGETLELISDDRRRTILYYLRAHEETRVEVDELVEHVTAVETETAAGNLPVEYADHVSQSLTHDELPTLDGANVIEFDHDDQTVRYAGWPLIDDLLDRTADVDEHR